MASSAESPVWDDAAVIAAFLATKAVESQRIYRTTLTQWQARCPQGLAQAPTSTALQWMADLEARGRSAKTRARTVHSLRSFYRFAHEVADWPGNPWALVPTPPTQDRPPAHILTAAELERLLTAAAADPRAYAIVQLLLTTGIRVGELTRARWQDVRLSDDGYTVLAIPGAHARHVKLVAPVWAALQAYRQALGLSNALNPEDSRPLIWGRSGRPVQPNTATAVVAQYAQLAGLTVGGRVTASWLRSAHAVWAHAGGAAPQDIQTALGLRSRRSVDRYLGAAPAVGQTSADAVSNALLHSGVRSLEPHDRDDPPAGGRR